MHSSDRARPTPESERGSATIDFLLISVAALAITASWSLISLAGFARVSELDLISMTAREVEYADNQIQGLGVPISLRIQNALLRMPVKVSLRSLKVEPWHPSGNATNFDGVVLTAEFSLPGLEFLPISSRVMAHGGSELNG